MIKKKLCDALNNVKMLMLLIWESDSDDYRIITASLLLNYIFELCRIYYILRVDPTYSGDVCSYDEHTGHEYDKNNNAMIQVNYYKYNSNGNQVNSKRRPSAYNTVMYTLMDIKNNYDNNIMARQGAQVISSNVSTTRNKCVHGISGIFDNIKDSIDLLCDASETLDYILCYLSHILKISYNEEVFYKQGVLTDICNIKLDNISNKTFINLANRPTQAELDSRISQISRVAHQETIIEKSTTQTDDELINITNNTDINTSDDNNSSPSAAFF